MNASEEELAIPGINVSGLFYPFCNICDPSGPPSPSYKAYNMIMTGILLPCVGLFGVVGNTISAYVYTRRRMLSSMNLYLCALAVSDICVITTAFFLFFMEGMRRYNATIAYMFGAGAPVFFPAGLAAQTCSVYFTVAAAIDCFLQVVTPKRVVQRCCTLKRALYVIVLIAVLAAAYNVSHCFEVSVIDCYDPKFSAVSLQVCMTDFRMNELYLEIYYVWMYTIVMACGPLVVLVILNVFIIGALALKKRKTSKKSAEQLHLSNTNGHAPLIQHLSQGTESGEVVEEAEEEVDAITLILVVFLFIFCNSLALIINFLEQSYYDQLGDALNYLVDVSNLFVVCNSSANILFYYFFGEAFRTTLDGLWQRRPPSVVGNGRAVEHPSPLHSPLPSPDDDGISASIHFYCEEPIDRAELTVNTHRL